MANSSGQRCDEKITLLTNFDLDFREEYFYTHNCIQKIWDISSCRLTSCPLVTFQDFIFSCAISETSPSFYPSRYPGWHIRHIFYSCDWPGNGTDVTFAGWLIFRKLTDFLLFKVLIQFAVRTKSIAENHTCASSKVKNIICQREILMSNETS
jgi:hypothetical protein